jgi:hypothetical protein
MKSLPHQIMLEWALDEERLFDDVFITKEGDVMDITRRLSVTERMGLLKSCAAFYAPTLKSVEAKATLDLDTMDIDALKAKLMTVLATAVKQERKSAH